MATTIMATRQVVEDYQRLFVNRRAYTMQSMRPHPETGRHYYFRPSKKGTDIPLMLTDETIRQHLEGKITVGLYAINPSTQRCKWVAIDADYKNSMEDLLKLQYHLTHKRCRRWRLAPLTSWAVRRRFFSSGCIQFTCWAKPTWRHARVVRLRQNSRKSSTTTASS